MSLLPEGHHWVAHEDPHEPDRWRILSVDGKAWVMAIQMNGEMTMERQRAIASILAASIDTYRALEMVRDADDDCRRDGLPTIPPMPRSKIDAAIAKAEGRA